MPVKETIIGDATRKTKEEEREREDCTKNIIYRSYDREIRAEIK